MKPPIKSKYSTHVKSSEPPCTSSPPLVGEAEMAVTCLLEYSVCRTKQYQQLGHRSINQYNVSITSCYSPSMAWPHRWHAHSGLLTTPSFQHSHTMSPPSVGPTPMMGSLPASCHTRVQPLTGKDGSSGSHGKQRWGGPGQVGTWSLRSGLARGGPLTTVFN